MPPRNLANAKIGRRRKGSADLITIDVDRGSETPLARQVYVFLRTAIVSGRMPAGARLPSTREAAGLWHLSRGIVATAYEILINEGYATGLIGSGTYAGHTQTKSVLSTTPGRGVLQQCAPRCVSQTTALALRTGATLEDQKQVAFAVGRATPDSQTLDALRRICRRHVNSLSAIHCEYRDAQGEIALREAVSVYLGASRSVRCDPSRIFIVSGSQQAIDLLARTLVDPGDLVWTENPCYPAARQALAMRGAKLAAIPVDETGLNVAFGIRHFPDARAAYVTPSNQYPTGAVLSMHNRLLLLDWARSVGAWIIEDDYDSEFRYNGPALASLQGLDDSDRVIYVGSFSKAIFPGFRTGYLVVPTDLVPAFRAVRALSDRFPAPFPQMVLADLLNEGHFVGHLQRQRKAYMRSRDLLISLLRTKAGEHIDVAIPVQGLHVVARSTGSWNDDYAVTRAASARGVMLRTISSMHIANRRVAKPGLVLGFTGFSDAELEMGVRRLVASIEGLQR